MITSYVADPMGIICDEKINLVQSNMQQLVKKGDATRTFSTKIDDVKSNYLCFDVSGISLGRAASQIARYLKGKHKVIYTPHLLCGDYVIVKNVDKILLTGNKKEQKIYYRHSGYFGGLKELPYEYVVNKDPTFPLFKAIERMFNKCPLRKRIMRRLFLFVGEHNMESYKPLNVEIK